MTNRIYLPANRSNIDSFYVMELLYNANKLEANGKKIFHLELGEPIPKTPKAVLNEASRLSRLSLPGYTPSNGIEELREKIRYYLKNKNARQKIIDQAFQYTMTNHTWAHRANKINSILEVLLIYPFL